MHPQGKDRLENIYLTAREANKKASLCLGYKGYGAKSISENWNPGPVITCIRGSNYFDHNT